jgi:hypothetical protein
VPENQDISNLGPSNVGWFESAQNGKGALALMFDNAAIRTLMTSRHLIDRSKAHNRDSNLDGGISSSMKKAGYREFTHSPSLVQHQGEKTTMGTKKTPLACRFFGEDFDATEMIDDTKVAKRKFKSPSKLTAIDRAVKKMIPPSQPRKNKWLNGVMQIHVTRACDKACFGCTQGSQLRGKASFMSPEQFESAVKSLDGYFGVFGVFGGNPALSPHFDDYCKILQEHVPKRQRGIWCNHPKGKGKIMRETFNPSFSNLNVHLDREAYDEFKRDWPESNVVGLDSDSRHSPVHGAMADLIGTKLPDGSEFTEEKMWDMVSRCDINQHWSAMIGVFRGELRAWFCEVAGSQSMIMQSHKMPDGSDYPDTGLMVEAGWWRKPMSDFSSQVNFHCQRCLFPLKGYGQLSQSCDSSCAEQTTEFYAEAFRPKRAERSVEIVTEICDFRPNSLSSNVDYLGNSQK